ncbi:MAG: AAA family ATPase, partial [Bacteroidales bacterium]|nr:AAA family ATPase [Bacteroidales bacterium]
MWSLLSIKSENIAAFRELDYSLTPGVTTLVFGKNKDNDSQGSNGSGKSALLEVISIALTGETLRKIKIDEIINDAYDEAFVEAVFFNSFTKETFKVSRCLFRKYSQKIACEIRDENNELIKQDETSQSGVSEYNKYILEKIGLTRDDLFGNFILSKHKYSSFLSSSDKDKKEIINRFSNAIIVDEAIEALNEDIAPVSEKLRQAELAVSKIEGSINAVEEQIIKAKDNEADKQQNKEQRKNQLNESIENQNQAISSARKAIRNEKERTGVLNEIYNQIVSCEENKDASLPESYRAILSLFSKNDISGFENWEEKS